MVRRLSVTPTVGRNVVLRKGKRQPLQSSRQLRARELTIDEAEIRLAMVLKDLGVTNARVLGEGFFGAVYRVEETGTPFALKVAKTVETDLEYEAEVMQRAVGNGAISPRVYDVGSMGNLGYFLMQYVQGERLEDRLGRVTILEAASAGKDLATSISACHRSGDIHHDIKPDNAVLARSGDVYLLDYGIANNHLIGGAVGTPQYTAPEKWHGVLDDPKSDLFSLGLTLHVLITNERLPMIRLDSGDNMLDYDIIKNRAYARLESAVPVEQRQAARKFQPVVDRLLAMDPNKRYRTSEQAVNALKLVTYRLGR